jgi:tetratricopeptide (TPR) repeat protein
VQVEHPTELGELLGRGVALRRLGRFKDAVAVFEKILQMDQAHVAALINRGIALAEMQVYPEAIASFERALAIAPDFVEALNNHGLALAKSGRHAEALQSYERGLKLQPERVDTLNNRSDSLFWLGRHAESLAGYDRALIADPDSIAALANRGRILGIFCRFDEALAGYERALALKPDLAEAWAGRASALSRLGRYEEALECVDYALRIRPDYVEAHLIEAHCRLRLGDFRAGLLKYEWRRLDKLQKLQLPECSGALWTGREDLRGKSILLRSEQGVGDVILFSRYAQLVADRGANVTFEVPAALAPLMAGLPGVNRALLQGQPPPPVDFHCQLLSLPLAFNTEPASIPAAVPYLSAALDRIKQWKARMPRRKELRIGIAWSGNSRQLDDCSRSIALKRLAPLLALRGVRFVGIQKDIRAADAAWMKNTKIIDLSAKLGDFSDTAAVMTLLDLVITVDTSVAHLAGAMGRPVWILLPFMAYWPWLLGRSDCPWYPTARLFRQPKIGDWDSVIRSVVGELDDRLNR